MREKGMSEKAKLETLVCTREGSPSATAWSLVVLADIGPSGMLVFEVESPDCMCLSLVALPSDQPLTWLVIAECS